MPTTLSQPRLLAAVNQGFRLPQGQLYYFVIYSSSTQHASNYQNRYMNKNTVNNRWQGEIQTHRQTKNRDRYRQVVNDIDR